MVKENKHAYKRLHGTGISYAGAAMNWRNFIPLQSNVANNLRYRIGKQEQRHEKLLDQLLSRDL